MTLYASVLRLRDELEQIPDAIRYEPILEEGKAGEEPAHPVASLGPGAYADTAPGGAQTPSTIAFEVPPTLTDADLNNAIGDRAETILQLESVKGIEAYGWYVTFHQKAHQHGIYLDISRIATLATGVLSATGLPLAERLQVAVDAVLQHELFHFSVDCMAANLELASGQACYWQTKESNRNNAGYFELEEQQANAYMLRTINFPGSRAERKAIRNALKNFCLRQPEGYSAGPFYSNPTERFFDECRGLAYFFWQANPSYGQSISDFHMSDRRAALDTLIFYPSLTAIDWRDCPIFILDEAGLLDQHGIKCDFFGAITNIVETDRFRKSLSKLDKRIVSLWAKRKEILATCANLQSLGFQPWPPGGKGCYSVRVDGNYRVHLRRQTGSAVWIAEKIGDHREMGHG